MIIMSLAEEEIRRAAELKQWVDSRMSELQREMERLKDFQVFLDAVLRKSSFRPAAEAKPQVVERVESKETRPMTRASDGRLLANAYITQLQVAIVPSSDTHLKVDTPPFRSFYVKRILEGMRGKDMEAVAQKKLSQDQVLSYDIQEESGLIKRVLVKNYREKGRLTEILNTATWVFSRMMEKEA